MVYPKLEIKTRDYSIYSFRYVNSNGIQCNTYIEVIN